MNVEEYLKYDAVGLAELVKTNQVSAEELLNTAIQRAEQVNPKINAIINPLYDLGRKMLRDLPDGDFKGVPFLLKDLGTPLASVPMSHGSQMLRYYVPQEDGTLAKRFKQSGVVIFGKTNTPEFGLMGTTEPKHFGPSRNPWNLEHTTGGSSGGSAAAIAGGIVPIASAGDGGGSIRIPAACCGLFGIKPSRGRVSLGPDRAEDWDGAVVEHILSRSVRDSAIMLDNVCGPAPGDPYFLPNPDVPYGEVAQQDPQPLKIAFSTYSPLGNPLHPECAAAVTDFAKRLESMGHHVEEATPDIDGYEVAKAYLTIYLGQVGAQIKRFKSIYGKKAVKEGLEEATRIFGLMGNALSATEYVEQKYQWNRFGRIMGEFHTCYDLFVSPVLAQPPSKLGTLLPSSTEELGLRWVEKLKAGRILLRSGLIEKIAIQSLEKTPFTQLGNLTGQPGMSLPLYSSSEGLPLGVQVMAALGREDLLFGLAGQMERAYPWFDRLPDLGG
ncbi:MAG: amidase [Pseudomonadales bacterium]|nr:amidase [Pseudomonadales bacterium]